MVSLGDQGGGHVEFVSGCNIWFVSNFWPSTLPSHKLVSQPLLTKQLSPSPILTSFPLSKLVVATLNISVREKRESGLNEN